MKDWQLCKYSQMIWHAMNVCGHALRGLPSVASNNPNAASDPAHSPSIAHTLRTKQNVQTPECWLTCRRATACADGSVAASPTAVQRLQ